MKLDVYNSKRETVGSLDLSDDLFGGRVKTDLIWEAVVQENAADRRGTHATKNRALVSGSGRKPWRQKGTGRARQGTIRAPQFTGGGHTFAKVPRTFVQKVNRKAAKAALRSALASHVAEGSFAVVDATMFETPSTKLARSFVEASGLQSPIVIVATEGEMNLVKSFRNLEKIAIVEPGELDVAAVVWARSLLVTESALPLIQGRAQ
jgi:large subunit ribosomal protein L4